MRRTATITATLLAVLALAGAAWLYAPQHGGEQRPPSCRVLLRTPPPHDQGRAPLCWLAAMLTTLETDRLNMGDSLRLSMAWPVRHSLLEQGRRAYLLAAQGGSATVSLRGTLPEAFRLLQEYGAVPEDSYPWERRFSTCVTGGAGFQPAAHHAAAAWKAASPSYAGWKPALQCGKPALPSRAVAHIARVFGTQRRGLDALTSALDRELDRELGPAPLRVYMLGMEYTPGEFARSIALPQDWRAYTSFTHHPYHTSFAPELPDNPQGHEAYNVTPRELTAIVTRSLRHGHPVAWEGCTRHLDTPSERQRLFESGRLTDDHCLTIVGCDASGIVCLNSWGERSKWVSMTWEQFLLNTIMIMARQ